MDQGQAAIWAAAIGVPGVLLSGVLSYRAGRRQIRDQGANEHLQWLRQQRQERFVDFLQAVDLCLKALEVHSGTIVSLSDRLGAGEVDAATYDFAPLYIPRDVLLRVDELGKSRDSLLMLGPEEVDARAQALFTAVLNYWTAHGDVLRALRAGPQPDNHPAWSEGPRVFRTGFWPFISRGDSQLLVLGVDFARRAVTHCRVEAFAIVPEFDLASDVLPGGLAGQVSHP